MGNSSQFVKNIEKLSESHKLFIAGATTLHELVCLFLANAVNKGQTYSAEEAITASLAEFINRHVANQKENSEISVQFTDVSTEQGTSFELAVKTAVPTSPVMH